MQFITLPILALAAAASASAIDASWNVTRSFRIISQQTTSYNLTAVFVSDAYPEGLTSQCLWLQKDFPVVGIRCTPDSFSIEPLADGTIKIQQTIEKPNEQVVYGEGQVPSEGHVVIPVSAGVA